LDGNADRFDLLFNQKPTSIFSTLEEVITSIGEKEMPPILVSEYLPGNELTIDTIVEDGVLLDCLIRTRTTINSGISTSGNFINDKEVFNYINKIVSSIPGLKGPIGFQIKKSAVGKYLLLESNPRIQGTSVAALGLGINLPVRAVDQALGINLKKVPKSSGISFIRYYQEAFYDS
ncbi:ATP-grasp domain-containing protein, partial [bacterium]|nr:ATP-grasp domain-containing protein [bacterium]